MRSRGLAPCVRVTHVTPAVSLWCTAAAREFINAGELSRLWRIPLPIAQQHLQEAETRATVCRDDTMRGLRFYPNKFPTLCP